MLGSIYQTIQQIKYARTTKFNESLIRLIVGLIRDACDCPAIPTVPVLFFLLYFILYYSTGMKSKMLIHMMIQCNIYDTSVKER